MLGFSAISETAIAEIPSVTTTSDGNPWYYYHLLQGDLMNGYLKQSTGSQNVTIGPFIDDTDFKTLETGLTIANTDIKLHKAGGTVANKNSGGATADGSNGLYQITFDATDTNTVGILSADVKVSGALVWRGTWYVLEEAVYDAMFAASSPGYLQPTTAGRTLDVSAGGEAGIDWANIGSPTSTNALTNTAITTTQVISQVSGTVASVTGTVGSVVGNVGGNVVGSVASVTGAVGSVTGNVGGNVTGSIGSLGAQAKLDVNAEADTAISDAALATAAKLLKYVQLLARKDSAIATDNATELTAINANGGSGAGAYDNTTDALEALQAASPPSAAAIADAVWDEATSGHTTAGTTGKALTDAGSAGDPWSTSVPGAYSAGTAGYILGTNLDATVGSRSTVTNASVADQVWEEAIADHSGTGGSTAEALNAAGSAGDPWVTALPGAYSAGQAGKIIGDNINATISSRSSHSAADVWSVGTRTLTSFGTLVADIWSYATRLLTGGANIVLAKGTGVTGFNDLSAAQVNAEVDTALMDYGPNTVAPDNSTISTINTKLGTPASSVSADIAAVKTDTGNLVTRITSTLFSGITSMASWLGALAGKTADTSTRTEINATTAGATYNETTDSGEARADELAKVHKSGETRRYTQVAANDTNKTADVSVGDAL